MSLNSYNLSKQSVVYGMFNQFVFNEAKTNIDLIERYFLTDPTTIGNNLIKELLDAIRKYDLGSIDEPLFRSILAGQGKTDTESNDILREIVRYKMCDTHQIDPIRQYMRGVGNQSLVDIAMSKYSNDPEGYIKYLRTHEYKADYADVFTTINFKDIDINTIQATSMGGWKSSFDFINDSFQPMRKYENGQIVMWVGAPGCFTGDTKVRLTDGTEISMKDLSEGIKDGKEFSTYCKTESGDTVETKIKDCWITRDTYNLTYVYIDNGSVIKCTSDHRFMMSDGSYKMSGELRNGDELMSYSGKNSVSEVENMTLSERIPVYDLEVENESHNFMLADGEIFVHNCGKTLSMINECLKMTLDGARTHYLALGDMNQKDFVQRMGAIYTGMSFGDTMKSISSVYNQLCNALGDRFSLTILPAATVTVDEYIEYMMSRINDFDVLFIDYDSNFKPTINDNMYKEGGYVYDNLTKLTKLGKLVHVASQPKIGSWRSEVLEITDAGESSRKQHNVDCMITLSRGGLDRNPNHIGYFKIAKNRRGEEGIVVPYIRLNNGRFRIIPQDVYNTIACIPDKRNYTDADINRMIDMSNNQMMQLQQQMTIQQGQANQSSGKSKSKGGKGQQPQQTFDPDSIISNAINQFKPLS